MLKWRGRNTLDIPGASDDPCDQPKGKKCPNCGVKIIILIPSFDPDADRVKLLCPNCGEEVRRPQNH